MIKIEGLKLKMISENIALRRKFTQMIPPNAVSTCHYFKTDESLKLQ